MELISETVTRCRKPRQCADCLQTIEPGERKLTQFLKDGGDVWTWISHKDCHSAAHEFLYHYDIKDGAPPLYKQIDEGQPIEDYDDDYPEVAARLRKLAEKRQGA